MPRSTKQQRPPAKPPDKAAIRAAAKAKWDGATFVVPPDVPALLASLADRFGVRPSDVPTFSPALPALRKAGVDPTKISPATVHHAGEVWRAAIADSMRVVDEINTAILRRHGEEGLYECVGGDVRLVRRVDVAPAVPPREEKPAKQSRGVEVLGVPVTQLICGAARAGFTFPAIRAALDELGGLGVSSATIRMHSHFNNESPELTDEQRAELEPFRDARPEPRPEKPARERPAPIVAPPPARRVGALL